MGKLLSKVYAFVATEFEGILDRGGSPYFEHCLAVMQGLPKSASTHMKVVALCHDVIEDIFNGREKLIRLGLTQEMIDDIDNLSKREGESLQNYKARVSMSDISLLVKMSDLEHNSDIRRLKGLTPKDMIRTIQYQEFYTELKEIALVRGILN